MKDELSPPTGMSALIVDDDNNCRFALRHFVKDWNWNVSEASSAEEAFEMLKDRKADIIFMDENMGTGRLKGHTAIRLLRNEKRYDGIIVGCSGNITGIRTKDGEVSTSGTPGTKAREL